jgi:predicted transposase YdaD
MGLRYPTELVDQLLEVEGVEDMEESTTYQAIVAKGRTEGRTEGLVEGLVEGELRFGRQMLLTQGRTRLGEPSAEALAALNAETSLSRLLELGKRVLDASSWDELFPPPAAGSSTRQRKRRGS